MHARHARVGSVGRVGRVEGVKRVERMERGGEEVERRWRGMAAKGLRNGWQRSALPPERRAVACYAMTSPMASATAYAMVGSDRQCYTWTCKDML